LKKNRLLFLLIVLNLTDVTTTFYGFSLGANEVNPLFPGQSFARPESLVIKIFLPVLYACLFTVTHRCCLKQGLSKGLQILNIGLFFLIGFYIIIVVNNLLQIAKATLGW